MLDKESGDAAEEVIVDSETGSILHRAPLVSSAINRQINDAFGSILYMWGYPRRYEGDGPAVQPQVNLLYDFMGQVYEYYSNMHGRDGYDGAGCAIRATARHVSTKGCPNALYNTPLDRFGFCAGMVADDIVAHEYTHAVTHNTACLEGGFTESGAIDESLSDIWGEFVDLTYGTDDPNDMWKLFEDTINGVARDMAEPHNELQPDYYGGEFWHTDMEPHFNAGVGNKLCYLLAAGDTDFYGNNYAPLSSSLTTSMSATIKLYHEIQTNRLLSTSNYQDLGSALNDAAIDACLGLIDLGNDITWNAVALQKVINDVVAVGID